MGTSGKKLRSSHTIERQPERDVHDDQRGDGVRDAAGSGRCAAPGWPSRPPGTIWVNIRMPRMTRLPGHPEARQGVGRGRREDDAPATVVEDGDLEADAAASVNHCGVAEDRLVAVQPEVEGEGGRQPGSARCSGWRLAMAIHSDGCHEEQSSRPTTRTPKPTAGPAAAATIRFARPARRALRGHVARANRSAAAGRRTTAGAGRVHLVVVDGHRVRRAAQPEAAPAAGCTATMMQEQQHRERRGVAEAQVC